MRMTDRDPMASSSARPLTTDPDISHVSQGYRICLLNECLAETLYQVICEFERHSLEKDIKILILLPTARATSLAASVFRMVSNRFSLLGRILETHSRKSQSARQNTFKQFFQNTRRGILFSSDISTKTSSSSSTISLVIQVGLPSSIEQYLLRVSKATVNRQGDARAILILADFEEWFLKQIQPFSNNLHPISIGSENTSLLEQCKQTVSMAMQKTDERIRIQAYQAHLGYYKSYLRQIGWDSQK